MKARLSYLSNKKRMKPFKRYKIDYWPYPKMTIKQSGYCGLRSL